MRRQQEQHMFPDDNGERDAAEEKKTHDEKK
jgi:hypothetical protein